ncbi:MAG: hypothetical protein QM739_07475 [Propionivibrio sp.]
MSEENNQAFLEFQAYWRVAEEMIGQASKDELADALRILAMQSAHYTRKYGELALPDLTELLATVTLDAGRLGLLKDRCIALVGVLGTVRSGELDEGGSQLH